MVGSWHKNDNLKFRVDEASADILNFMHDEFGLQPSATIRFALMHLNLTTHRAAEQGDAEAFRVIAETRALMKEHGLDAVDNHRGRPKKGRNP